jgi:hypothetical protein
MAQSRTRSRRRVKRGGRKKLYGAAAKAHAKKLARGGHAKRRAKRGGRKKLYGAAAKAHARKVRSRASVHGMPIYTPPSHQLGSGMGEHRRRRGKKRSHAGTAALARKVSSIDKRLHRVEKVQHRAILRLGSGR